MEYKHGRCTSETSVAVRWLGQLMAVERGPSEMNVLGERLALALEQAVACLSSLQLGLHNAQRLSRREDGFPVLRAALAGI